MPDRRGYEKLLFDYGTINRTDYRGQQNPPETPLEEPKDEVKECIQKLLAESSEQDLEPLKYLHTMTGWKKGRVVPFNLFHTPKEIVRTNPRLPQPAFERPPDLMRREVQRTRPRLVMTPACALDDIEDDRVRDLIVPDIYTSTVMAMQSKIKNEYLSVRAPLGGTYEPTNIITLRRNDTPIVDPEWRQEMLGWDDKQLRLYGENMKYFWSHVPTTCKFCDWGVASWTKDGEQKQDVAQAKEVEQTKELEVKETQRA